MEIPITVAQRDGGKPLAVLLDETREVRPGDTLRLEVPYEHEPVAWIDAKPVAWIDAKPIMVRVRAEVVEVVGLMAGEEARAAWLAEHGLTFLGARRRGRVASRRVALD